MNLIEATRLIDIEIPTEEEKFVFSEVQTAKIINALTQIKSFEYLTSEVANKEIEEVFETHPN